MSGADKDTGLSELDKLRAEMEAEQRAEAAPAAAAAPKPLPKQARAKSKPGAPKPRGRPRTGARVAAVQALYQSDHTGESAEAVIQQFLRTASARCPAAAATRRAGSPRPTCRCSAPSSARRRKNGDTLDGILTGLLDADWPLSKLDPVLRALLRAAAAELWGERRRMRRRPRW